MPILTFAEVIPSKSPEIGKLMYPSFNNTNMFNLTAYEVTPFEFGSWLGGRVQAFINTEYLGTAMSKGKAQNTSECVRGFDKLTLMQVSTANVFTALFIDLFYGVPVFAKRDLDKREQVDLVIVYEASSDAANSWVNGTNLVNSALAASEDNIPFPQIPDVNIVVIQNLTKQPTFFGCNATRNTPLVLYLPNAPWTGYSNYSYQQTEFTDEQVETALENAFKIATYGNGTVDENWPACLACATIKGSLEHLSIKLPSQCQKCFEKHCWDGKNSTTKVTAADFDLTPRLGPNLTYEEWNKTKWSAGSSGSGAGSVEDDDSAASMSLVSFVGLSVSVFVMVVLM
ncbi:hypothetical protein FALCPG4_018217 [Fusarium falciforme]